MLYKIQTLHAVGQIPQVEDVMGLGGSWQKVSAHVLINLHRTVHHSFDGLTHGHGELVEEAVQYGLKR